MKKPEKEFHYGAPCLDQDDIDAVVSVLKSRWLTTGPKIEEFEKSFSEYVGCENVVACSNGTAALYLACKGIGLSKNNWVVVPSITFLATANAPRLASAEIIFADVCPKTGLITPETFLEALEKTGKNVCGALPVHMNGLACQMREIFEIASHFQLEVIEDACHALGTCDTGNPLKVGSCQYSKMSTFSFHPVKNITMGEGGAITTNDQLLAQKLRELRNHGMQKVAPYPFSDHSSHHYLDSLMYSLESPSFNFRVTDISCALGISQLKKLPQFIKKRREIKEHYECRLSQYNPHITPVVANTRNTIAWHLCPIQIDFKHFKKTKSQICSLLAERGILTQVHYFPVHRQPYYRQRYGDISLPGADAYFDATLSFPLNYGMTIDDVDHICDTLLNILLGK